MRIVLISILLVQAAPAADGPPPVLVPDQIWAAEGGVRPTTQPGKPYDGINDALKVVPQGVLPSRPEEWNVAKIDAANLAFEARVRGKQMRLRVKVQSVEKEGEDYDVITAPVVTSIYTTDTHVHFSKKNVLEVALLKVGDEVTVEGTTGNMYFQQPQVVNDAMQLRVDLSESRALE